MKTIAIDVDGVLRNLLDMIHNTMEYHLNTKVEYNLVDCTYEFNTIFPEYTDEYIRNFMYHEYPKECFYLAETYRGAIEFMHWLRKQPVKLIIVTAQPNCNTQKYTMEWLVSKHICFDAIYFTFDKQEVDFDILIDDSTDILDKVQKAGKDYIIMSRPWNHNYKGKRAYDFTNLKELISKYITEC